MLSLLERLRVLLVALWAQASAWIRHDAAVADYQFLLPHLPRISVGAGLVAGDLAQLQADHIGYVIDVTQHDDNDFLRASGIDVLWVNTGDDGQSKKELFKGLVAPWFIARWWADPGKRWNVHCDAGINRSSSTCMFVLMLLGLSAADAEDFIRQARPQVGLAYKIDAILAAEELGYLVR